MNIDSQQQTDFEKTWSSPEGWLGWLTAVNNQPLAKRFIVTAFVFFILGGIQGLLVRAQLTVPGNTLMGPDAYNQLFTMHGSTMMYLFAVPLLEGLALYFLPQMLGTRDVAFPRLTAFSYWTYLFGGLLFYASYFWDVVPDAGWFAYTPLSGPKFSGLGVDFWLLGLSLVELAGITAGVEIVVTILKFRAPGMSLNRMPLFIWAMLVAGVMIIFAFTTLLTATVLLELDRTAGTCFFHPDKGGNSLLWQHLFWFFGHPEVYIMFIPATGIISMVVCTVARRPMVGYSLVVSAIVVIGFVSFGLWVHHMYTTGLPELAMAFFTAASLMIGIASGIQVFAWIATLWGTRPKMGSPTLYTAGFLFIFVLGGFTGVMVAVVPFDWQMHDTFFIVAHFHYVLIGGVVFPMFAGLHHWFPKLTGRLMDETLGKWGFWFIFIGFNATFFPMHIMGFLGMPRRVYTYPAELGLQNYNLLASGGAVVMGFGFLIFFWNCVRSLRSGAKAGANPWGADSLEWSISSPPPVYSFSRIPVVRSRHPLWVSELQDSRDDWIEKVRDALHFAPVQWRGTLVTDALNAKPEAIQPLPGPSALPLALGLAVLVGFVGVLAKVYLLSAVAVVVSLIVMVLWLWPDSQRIAAIRSSGIDTDSGLPLFATGNRSTAWWAMVGFLAILVTAFGVMFYSYFYLQLFSDQWPQDSIERPEIWTGAGSALFAVVGAVCAWGGARFFRSKRKAEPMLIAACLLGIASLVSHVLGLMDLSFTPQTNAYGSVYWVTSGLFFVPLLLAIVFTTCVGCLCIFSSMDREVVGLSMDLTVLLWYVLAGSALAVFIVLNLSPYIIG